MTPPEFELAFEKIKKRWPKFYTPEMEEQAFSVCGFLPYDFFARRISEAVWQNHAPKIDWFHETVSSYRRKQDFKHSLEQMSPVQNSIFSNDDIARMKKYAYLRMDGRLSDEEYHNFQKTIREMVASGNDIRCKRCLDMGSYLPYGQANIIDCTCRSTHG